LGGDVESLAERAAEEAEESGGVALSAASLAGAAVLSVTAGITEEIIFRAYAITRLQELGWRRAAVVVPGVVFTLLHLYQGVWAIVLIGAVTAVFTALYVWKRSIWPVVIAHVLFDAAQFTIQAVSG